MSKKSFLLKIFLIFLIFFIPLLLAWYFYNSGLVKHSTTNYGYLLPKPIPLASLQLSPDATPATKGKWLLIFVSDADCDKQCQQQLYFMRQIRTALGKDRDRLQRVIITPEGVNTPLLSPLLTTDYAGTQHWQIKPAALTELLQQVSKAGIDSSADVVFIADPLSNIILIYGPKVKPRDWLRDLKHLLAVSQIG